MSYSIKTYAALVLLFVLMGCNSLKSTYQIYDRSVDFTQYQTFAWLPDSSSAGTAANKHTFFSSDAIRNNAKNYINQGLIKRGYMVDTDSPDIVLQLVLLNKQQKEVPPRHAPFFSPYYFDGTDRFPYYYPFPRLYTWSGWRYSPHWNNFTDIPYTKAYTRGTITINMFDRSLNKLIWSGSAEGDMYDPAYVRHGIHPAIDLILDKFPVGANSTNKRKGDIKPGPKVAKADSMYR
jgi:hypothetical protein